MADRKSEYLECSEALVRVLVLLKLPSGPAEPLGFVIMQNRQTSRQIMRLIPIHSLTVGRTFLRIYALQHS